LPVPYSDLTNPQNLNLYAYRANNPVRFSDLDGHWHQEYQHNNSTNTDTAGTIHVTVYEHCDSVPDFWDENW